MNTGGDASAFNRSRPRTSWGVACRSKGRDDAGAKSSQLLPTQLRHSRCIPKHSLPIGEKGALVHRVGANEGMV